MYMPVGHKVGFQGFSRRLTPSWSSLSLLLWGVKNAGISLCISSMNDEFDSK